MNLKNIIISEQEKHDILKSHGLINEQQTTPKSVLNISKNITFRGGYYKLSEKVKATLDVELNKAKTFLKAGAGKSYLVAVKLTSGESQLPNYDNEVSPAEKVNVGYLSGKRMETIETYINESLEPFVTNKLLLQLPAIQKEEPKIGATKWVGQKWCPSNKLTDDPQGYTCSAVDFKPGPGILNWKSGKTSTYKSFVTTYKNEQFMKMELKLVSVGDVRKCLDNMVINVDYTDTSKRHVCNSAKFFIYVNGIKLIRADGKNYASLNNNGNKEDNKGQTTLATCNSNNMEHSSCRRYNKFVISPDLALKLLGRAVLNTDAAGKPQFKIQAQCASDDWGGKAGGGCHEGVGNITIVNGLNVPNKFVSATPRRPSDGLKTLVTFDACGAGKQSA